MLLPASLGIGLLLGTFDPDAATGLPEAPEMARPRSNLSGQDQPTQTDSDPKITTIVVKGKRLRRRIDRDTYDNTQTLGTAADALRHIPSVAVDANGRIYFRGNTNVQVYIDGQPSAMMGEDVRGLVLNAMPSNAISSIEVIALPGAGMASGDGGPIINLVTNRNRKPGGFVSADLTTNGSNRGGLNLTGSYGDGKLTANGGLSYRDETQNNTNESQIETLDDSHARLSLSKMQNRQTNQTQSASLNGGITYSANPHNSLSAQVMLNRSEFYGDVLGYQGVLDAVGTATSMYEVKTVQTGNNNGHNLSLNWTYTDLDKGETLKLDLRVSRNAGYNRQINIYDYTLPSVRQTKDQVQSESDTAMSSVSFDYELAAGDGQVTAGLNYGQTKGAFNTLVTGDGEIDNALLSNRYENRQTVSAAYCTYQRPLGEKWMFLAGLRGEQYQIDTDQAGTPLNDSYTQWKPSMFVVYQLTQTAKWRLAYSRDQQQPGLQARNPNLVYQDAQNVAQGNPSLKPQTTDNFELSYETFSENKSMQASIYYNPTTAVVVPVTRTLTTGVILHTQENGGMGYSTGMNLNTGRQLTPKLNTQFGFGIARNSREGTETTREEATALNGQVSLVYAPTANDNYMLMYMIQGNSLTGQGTTQPFVFSTLNYTHTFSPKLALTIDFQNPFGGGRFRSRSKSQNLIMESDNQNDAQIMMVSLRRSFVRFTR